MEEIEDCAHTVQFWSRDVDFCIISEENFNFVVKNRHVSWSTDGNLNSAFIAKWRCNRKGLLISTWCQFCWKSQSGMLYVERAQQWCATKSQTFRPLFKKDSSTLFFLPLRQSKDNNEGSVSVRTGLIVVLIICCASTFLVAYISTTTPEGKWSRRRPKTNRRRTVEKGLRELNYSWSTIEKLAKDRQRWKDFVAGCPKCQIGMMGSK